MDSIILQNEINNHSVQRYQFKVLGAKIAEEDMFIQSTNQDISTKLTNSAKITDGAQNNFTEELLKRSDDLSANILKLQTQIEKQEEEFERRLSEDLIREKEKSFNEGCEKAKSDLEENYNATIVKYNNSNQKLNEKIDEIDKEFKKIENDLVNSAVEIAKEVIKRELATSSSEIAVELSKNLLLEIKDANTITLKTNPDDFSALNEIYKNSDKIKVEEDDAISKGGVILLSESGNLDGTISERLEKAKQLLKDS